MNTLNFSVFPEIITGHFRLRELNQTDKNEIFILRSDSGVLEYLDIKKADSVDDAAAFIDMIQTAIKNNESIYWVISSREAGAFLGTVCLWNFSRDKLMADIGFTLLPQFQGKGIMQEIIPAVLKYGFEVLGLTAIAGEVAPGNIKSVKLLEKFGFRQHSHNDHTLIYILENSAGRRNA